MTVAKRDRVGAMQTSTAPGETLLDFRQAGPPDFAVPRDFDQPEDERVMVIDPADPQAWRSQVSGWSLV